jgi:hypothetical protein
VKVNLGDKKVRCRDCSLWSPAGKACIWCGSTDTSQPMMKVRCEVCHKITYVQRSALYDKLRCSWCHADISVVK